MVRLNLSSDNVTNCEETTMFVKEYKNKGILNLEKNGASKTCKSARKVSKTKSGNEFK